MDQNLDLQSWAKEVRIWEFDSWKPYLDQLLNVYNQALKFKEFHNWLKEAFDGRSIVDLPIERNSARMCISGGGSEKNAFGRLMFEKFGVGVKNCKNYKQSLEEYERCGDWVEMSVGNVVLGWKHYDDSFLNPLKDVIDYLAGVLNVNVGELEIKEDFTEWIKYPNPKLTEKLEKFLNDLAGMLEFTNHYTMLMRYFILAPLPMIARFLDVGIDEIKKLAELWNIKFVYDANLNRVNISNIERSKAYELFWISIDENCLPQKILKLFGYNGLAQKLIEQFKSILDINLDETLHKLWINRFLALNNFKETGRWNIDEKLKDALLGTINSDKQEFLVSIENEFVKEIRYPVIDLSKPPVYDYERHKVIYESTATKVLSLDELHITRFLNQIFPLTATGFLEPVKIEDNTITFRFNDIPVLDRLGVLFS